MKRDEKRKALRENLILSTEKLIKSGGLQALRARDITADVGCALGGLYTAFEDLDDLVLHVNARTLDTMGGALEAATKDLEPRDALRALALEYARFAQDNRMLWDALYDHKTADDDPMPDWFRKHQRDLIRHIVLPLASLQPTLSEDELHLRARTYFSAIHGIVSISLQGRFVGLPGDHLHSELERFVAYIIAGSLGGERA